MVTIKKKCISFAIILFLMLGLLACFGTMNVSEVNAINLPEGSIETAGMKAVKSQKVQTHLWICTKDIVEDSLKNPKSADFCWQNEASFYKIKKKDYMVQGYVYATNEYGGEVKTDFCCYLTKTKRGYKNGYVVFDE